MPRLKSLSLIEAIGCREEAKMRIAAARDTLSSLPGSGAIKPMPEAEIARAVQLLDLMLDFFAHDGHWTRGSYDDGNGGHCHIRRWRGSFYLDFGEQPGLNRGVCPLSLGIITGEAAGLDDYGAPARRRCRNECR
jgi:hypothetical protein